MKQYYFLLISLFLSIFVYAQQKTDSSWVPNHEINLDEVVVSANNFKEKKRNIAQKIDLINAQTIAQTNAQNMGDLLMNAGNIFVQKSQQGGSSPVLRGFEASRILLVIDGVRMNNAIYRSGHLQNSITVDQNMLSVVEIMYGPSSTVYGSDALGGTIQFITKSPLFSDNSNLLIKGSAFSRYSSANMEKTIHADANIGGKKIAWLQSYNYADFGDLKMGNDYLAAYPDFGRRKYYIDQINGLDTLLKNDDDRIQKFSGYKQWDMMQKLLVKQSEKISHLLNLQISNTNDVPRYDRLQDTFATGANQGLLRFAKWYYGPQKRILGAYEFYAKNPGYLDELKVNINYQVIEESRHQREYKRYDRSDSRVEKVKVWGATVTGRKTTGNNEWTFGLDAQLNKVRSTASRTNLLSGAVSKLDTRYPDGKNIMNNAGLFVQHLYKFSNKKLVINDGIRIQSLNLESNVSDNSFFNLPDTAVKQNYWAVTGNIGLVFNPAKNTAISLSVSSGFRAPNIDDLAKIFESNSQARQVVVPNANIKPEYTYNFDLSVKQKVLDKMSLVLTGYYTLFRNGLVTAPFQLNGQDSIIYNGVKSQVLSSQNSNKAYLYGFTAGLTTEILKGFSFITNWSYCYGRFKTDATKLYGVYEKQSNGVYALVKRNLSSKPMDHIPPLMGKAALSFQNKILRTEMNVMYNGWKKLDLYNADGEDNAQYATPDGAPAWYTLNWKATINITKYLQVQLAADNILDRNYRYFASGFNSPGRNFLLALRTSW